MRGEQRDTHSAETDVTSLDLRWPSDCTISPSNPVESSILVELKHILGDVTYVEQHWSLLSDRTGSGRCGRRTFCAPFRRGNARSHRPKGRRRKIGPERRGA